MFFQKASNSADRHNSSSGSRSAHGASFHSTRSASYAVGSSHRSGLRSKEVVITDPYLDALTKDTKARTRKRFSVSTSWTKISKSFALIFWGGSFCSLKPDNDQIMAQLRGLQSAFFGKIPRSVNGLRLCSFPSRLDYQCCLGKWPCAPGEDQRLDSMVLDGRNQAHMSIPESLHLSIKI